MKALPNQVIQYPTQSLINGLQARKLGLSIHATPDLFVKGILKLRCSATILLTYSFEASRSLSGGAPTEPIISSSPSLDSSFGSSNNFHHSSHHHYNPSKDSNNNNGFYLNEGKSCLEYFPSFILLFLTMKVWTISIHCLKWAIDDDDALGAPL